MGLHMRKILSLTRLMLASSIVSGLCAIPVASQQPRPAFEFVDANTALALEADHDNRAVVLNNTARTLSLTVAVVDDSAQDGPRLSSVMTVSPGVLEVGKASSGTIILKMSPSDSIKPGTLLTGYLTVFEEASNTVVRRALQFRVPAKETGEPQAELSSLVSSTTSTVYYVPWAGTKHLAPLDAPLPLTIPISAGEVAKVLKAGSVVARLATDNGESGLVEYTGTKENLPSGTTGLVLGFRSAGEVGTYKGKFLNIKTADKEPQPVTINVISKHYWIFPALAIAAGLFMYYAMQWYLNVLRKVWGLQEQEAGVEVAFAKAEQQFAEDAKGHSYSKYSISEDFNKQSKALLATISGLKLRNFFRLDESSEEYRGVVNALSDLEALARDWAGFAATKLTPLETALEAARPSFATVPEHLSLGEMTAPVIATEAAGLLAGGPEISISKLKDLSARIVDVLPRITSWPDLSTRAAKVWYAFDAAMKASSYLLRDSYEQAEIKANKGQAFIVWRDLWVEGAFDPKSLEDQLSKLENALAIINASSPTPVADASNFAFAADLSPTGMPALAPERLGDIKRKRLTLDLFFLMLAIALALYSGLNELYFMVPFGTARDYLNAFVWGFATKVIIDAITAGINKFWPAVSR